MNIESMRLRSCRSFQIDDAELPPAARERLLAIRRHDEAIAEGCAARTALKVAGVSRRTMFRWKAAASRPTRPTRRSRRTATAFNARRFLDAVLKDMPATVQSIQVGGGEFMRHSWRSHGAPNFEDACGKLGVELHVLPPRRPQWNGRVDAD